MVIANVANREIQQYKYPYSFELEAKADIIECDNDIRQCGANRIWEYPSQNDIDVHIR